MSIYFGNFQPHKVANTGLYFQRKDSTVSLCTDYSANGYNVTQGTAVNQPTLATNSINFTSPQFMSRTVANAFISDSSGYIFFSGYYNNASLNVIFSSADVPTTNNLFTVFINTSGQISLAARTTVTNQFRGNTVISNGAYYYGWVRSDGSTYTAMVNGVSQTITMDTGVNDGRWFNNVPNRDNISIGAVVRASLIYGSTQINKLHYVSGSPSAIDLWKLERFFENPLNYI